MIAFNRVNNLLVSSRLGVRGCVGVHATRLLEPTTLNPKPEPLRRLGCFFRCSMGRLGFQGT